MTSLFSPFDTYFFSLPFLFILLASILVFSEVYKLSPLQGVQKFLFSALGEFFFSLKPKFLNKSSVLFFMGLFFLFLLCNFFSVFPYNFPWTSQISSVFLVSGSFWMSMVVFSILMNFKGFFSHLIPEGTPIPLTVLLFVIELVSSVIRPLTLTVRLVANILAGHLLMSLLSSLVMKFELAGALYVGLNLVEMFVALIQSYIFCTMIVLYFSEV